jgi:hypothetical protein
MAPAVIGMTQKSVGVLAQATGDGLNRAGVKGQALKPGGTGVYGEAVGGFGVVGIVSSGVGFSGWFGGGPLIVFSELLVTGGKSAVVPHSDGFHRRFFAVESPESWFEDYGEAELVEGSAEIRLDPDFAHFVDTNHYHVFLSPYGETTGIHVARRHREGFSVVAKESHGRIKFSYRIVAKRKDVKHVRLEKVQLPPPPVAPSISTDHLNQLPEPPTVQLPRQGSY